MQSLNPGNVLTAPEAALEVNQKMKHGDNYRFPQDAKSAVQPVRYEGDCVAEMGLVVTLEDAIDHWNENLAAWEALKKTEPAWPTRYRVDGRTPFVVVSCNSALKDIAKVPHGPAAITAMLLQLRAAGWQYVWWDWLLINDGTHAYVQADVENAMTWAQSNA